MHLMKFIEKSRSHSLILSAKKTEIAKEQIEFLGLKINHQGIEMQPLVCKKIANFSDKLTDRKQVERFLGCINYISDFIPDPAWLRGPLQNLLKKRLNLQWQDYHTSLVQQLKKLCMQLPKLAIPEEVINLSSKPTHQIFTGEQFSKQGNLIIKSISVDMQKEASNQLK